MASPPGGTANTEGGATIEGLTWKPAGRGGTPLA
jgi:hypothetical protein